MSHRLDTSTRHPKDMFAVCVTALLCWLAVGHSAPLSCEDLLRPVDDLQFQHLEGRWALVAASLQDAAHVSQFNNSESAAVIFGRSNDSSEISFTRVFNSGDACVYAHTNITLDGSGFTAPQLNVTSTVLKASCDDCLVMKINTLAENARMFLISRTREVEQKEMEEFKAQAACLNMTAPILKDPTKRLCPDQVQPTPKAEEVTGSQKA